MTRRSANRSSAQDEQGNPYKQLWSAVMVRALDDFAVLLKAHKSLEHPAVVVSEPYYWLLDSEEMAPGSFIWICGHLGWDVEITRQTIRTRWDRLTRRRSETTVTD